MTLFSYLSTAAVGKYKIYRGIYHFKSCRIELPGDTLHLDYMQFFFVYIQRKNAIK